MSNYVATYPTIDDLWAVVSYGLLEGQRGDQGNGGVHGEWMVGNIPTHIKETLTYLRDMAEAKIAVGKPCNYCPSPDLLLEVLRWMVPSQVRVVILGQDPYPNLVDACGIAFQSFAPNPPQSALRINENLGHWGHIPPTELNISTYQTWLRQGVLLLNTSLTVEEGKAGSHTWLWEDRKVTDELLNLVPKKSVALLLGGEAQKKGQHLPCQVKISFMHPVARTTPGFVSRDVFKEVNEGLVGMGYPPINWRPGV
jgi:uracil-DNA glycosylase